MFVLAIVQGVTSIIWLIVMCVQIHDGLFDTWTEFLEFTASGSRASVFYMGILFLTGTFFWSLIMVSNILHAIRRRGMTEEDQIEEILAQLPFPEPKPN